MIGKTKKILIIGSAPDSVNATKWKNISFDNIVAINNAWKVRKDWTNCIYPEDFPEHKRPNLAKHKLCILRKNMLKHKITLVVLYMLEVLWLLRPDIGFYISLNLK